MAEQLPEITDEKIEKAALPKGKRANEEVLEESTFIELEGKDLEGLSSIEEETVQEDFKTSPHVEKQAENIENEAEKRAKLAQNRIDKAVKQAKDYQRRELQALQYAKQIAEENKKLKNEQAQISQSYGAEFGARVESQLEASKIALQKAMEEGEAEKIAEAQSILATASADKVAYDQYQKQLETYNREMEQYNAEQQAYIQEQRISAQQQNQNASQPVYQQPSQKAQSWANDNTWFGQDPVMTNVAIAVHEQLAQEGFDTESEDYYSEINKRMRQELPNKFQDNVEADGKPVQTVASPSRSNSNGRRKNRNQVELTPSEQQLAKRLGVSFKDYAVHKARLDNS
tara:strand:+ start:1374 stop:2405 length:1032 start_codon:yes stop_codon:yes gene_type:complete